MQRENSAPTGAENRIALLVEGSGVLGATKQRCDVDVEACGGSIAALVHQLQSQLYDPETGHPVALPRNVHVDTYDVLSRRFVPLHSLTQLRDRTRLRLRHGTEDEGHGHGTAPAGRLHELTLDVVAAVVAQLSAFAYDDVPVSDIALDNVVVACKRRRAASSGVGEEPLAAPAVVEQLAQVRAAITAGYEQGKATQRRHPLEAQVSNLQQHCKQLEELLEQRTRRVSELEKALAAASAGGRSGSGNFCRAAQQGLNSPPKFADVSTPPRGAPLRFGATPLHPPPPPNTPATSSCWSPPAPRSTALSLTPLLRAAHNGGNPERDGDDDDEDEDEKDRAGRRTPPNTPQFAPHISAGAPPMSPGLLSVSAAATAFHSPPTRSGGGHGGVTDVSWAAEEGPSTISDAAARSRVPAAPATPPPHHTNPAAASERGEAYMVSVFYNSFDAARRMMTKRGRAIALTRGAVPFLLQLQRAVCHAFSRPTLEIGYVHFDGATRVIIDTDDALELYLRGHVQRGSRPVLQCFDIDDEPPIAPSPPRSMASPPAPPAPHQPHYSRAGTPSNTSRPPSAMRHSRPVSAMSVCSVASLPYDAERGCVLDDDELQFQFGLVSKDGKTAHKADVMSYLQARYDDMGDTHRFQSILARFRRPQLSADEFAIVLLKLSAS